MASQYSMKVYRYMSFRRFCELLFHQEVALVHPSKWPDQYETSVIRILQDPRNCRALETLFTSHGLSFEKQFDSFLEIIQYEMDNMFCLCFSRSKDAEVMWNAYSFQNNSVMIRTSIEKLQALDPESLTVFRVRYDLENSILGTLLDNCTFQGDNVSSFSNIDEIIKHKRKCFRYENEMRLVGISPFEGPHRINNGILYLPIENISDFVERVMVHPLADDGYVALIKEMCAHFGINFWGRSKIYEFKGM